MRHTLNPACDCIECERAKFEHRAVLVMVALAGLALAGGATWLNAAWIRWLVDQ